MSMLEQKQLKAHRDSVHRDCQFIAVKSKVDTGGFHSLGQFMAFTGAALEDSTLMSQ